MVGTARMGGGCGARNGFAARSVADGERFGARGGGGARVDRHGRVGSAFLHRGDHGPAAPRRSRVSAGLASVARGPARAGVRARCSSVGAVRPAQRGRRVGADRLPRRRGGIRAPLAGAGRRVDRGVAGCGVPLAGTMPGPAARDGRAGRGGAGGVPVRRSRGAGRHGGRGRVPGSRSGVSRRRVGPSRRSRRGACGVAGDGRGGGPARAGGCGRRGGAGIRAGVRRACLDRARGGGTRRLGRGGRSGQATRRERGARGRRGAHRRCGPVVCVRPGPGDRCVGGAWSGRARAARGGVVCGALPAGGSGAATPRRGLAGRARGAHARLCGRLRVHQSRGARGVLRRAAHAGATVRGAGRGGSRRRPPRVGRRSPDAGGPGAHTGARRDRSARALARRVGVSRCAARTRASGVGRRLRGAVVAMAGAPASGARPGRCRGTVRRGAGVPGGPVRRRAGRGRPRRGTGRHDPGARRRSLDAGRLRTRTGRDAARPGAEQRPHARRSRADPRPRRPHWWDGGTARDSRSPLGRRSHTGSGRVRDGDRRRPSGRPPGGHALARRLMDGERRMAADRLRGAGGQRHERDTARRAPWSAHPAARRCGADGPVGRSARTPGQSGCAQGGASRQRERRAHRRPARMASRMRGHLGRRRQPVRSPAWHGTAGAA